MENPYSLRCLLCNREEPSYLDACIQQLRAHEHTVRLAAEEQVREELHRLQVEYDVVGSGVRKV